MTLALRYASVVWLLLATAAAAQPSASGDSEAYSTAINEAVSEFKAGRLAEAREQFQQAHSIDPNGRTFRGLGIVEYELGNYVASARMLEQALASTRKPLTGTLRTQTERMLERARTYIGAVRFEIEPASATVSVDGTVVDLDASSTLQLDVGDHVFEFHARGRLSTKQTVSVKGRKTQTLRVTLRPSPDTMVAAPPGATAPDRERSTSRVDDESLFEKWWVWTAIGVVVAGGATTAILLLTREETTETVPLGTSNTPPGSTIQTLEVAF
jgi:hypothetical protein